MHKHNKEKNWKQWPEEKTDGKRMIGDDDRRMEPPTFVVVGETGLISASESQELIGGTLPCGRTWAALNDSVLGGRRPSCLPAVPSVSGNELMSDDFWFRLDFLNGGFRWIHAAGSGVSCVVRCTTDSDVSRSTGSESTMPPFDRLRPWNEECQLWTSTSEATTAEPDAAGVSCGSCFRWWWWWQVNSVERCEGRRRCRRPNELWWTQSRDGCPTLRSLASSPDDTKLELQVSLSDVWLFATLAASIGDISSMSASSATRSQLERLVAVHGVCRALSTGGSEWRRSDSVPPDGLGASGDCDTFLLTTDSIVSISSHQRVAEATLSTQASSFSSGTSASTTVPMDSSMLSAWRLEFDIVIWLSEFDFRPSAVEFAENVLGSDEHLTRFVTSSSDSFTPSRLAVPAQYVESDECFRSHSDVFSNDDEFLDDTWRSPSSSSGCDDDGMSFDALPLPHGLCRL